VLGNGENRIRHPPQEHGEAQNGGHNCENHPIFKKLLVLCVNEKSQIQACT